MPDATHTGFAAGLDEHLAVVEAARGLLPHLAAVEAAVRSSLGNGGRLLAFGNGGSAADAQHLAGELVGRFQRERAALPAMSLATDPSVMTCIANDYAFDAVFERQVQAQARPGDVVVAFTTSGTSPNVVRALAAARSAGATTVLFTGNPGAGGPALREADLAVVVPSASTPRIQEVHGLLVHLLSEAIDIWAAARETPAAAARR